MTKPIFIIGLPIGMDIDHVDLEEKLPEYYVLVYASNELTIPVFECFYEKDFNKVRFEELKQIVIDSVKRKDP